MRLKNKKGWIRILEVFIAITLISGALVFIYSNKNDADKKSEDIYRIEKKILDEAASNSSLRDAVLQDNEERVSDFVEKKIPSGFNFTVKICKIGKICNLDEYRGLEGRDIYSAERSVSANLTTYSPKKIKIFMW